jgi:16S rRNA (guanine(966)-N(2))-methyltransferase RsmD
MQVTTGSAKGRKLKSVKGDTTRPITDRAKQGLFNILGDDVRNTRWIDLFAGTGAVGIEALSRGASEVTFVDMSPAAIEVIRENLHITGLSAKGKVVRFDAFKFIAGRPNATYDFIYVAPPQYQGLWSRALLALDENISWLNDEGTVVVQIDPKEYTSIALKHFELGDERRYGNTLVQFYDRMS